jgi:hypothetical protein
MMDKIKLKTNDGLMYVIVHTGQRKKDKKTKDKKQTTPSIRLIVTRSQYSSVPLGYKDD